MILRTCERRSETFFFRKRNFSVRERSFPFRKRNFRFVSAPISTRDISLRKSFVPRLECFADAAKQLLHLRLPTRFIPAKAGIQPRGHDEAGVISREVVESDAKRQAL